MDKVHTQFPFFASFLNFNNSLAYHPPSYTAAVTPNGDCRDRNQTRGNNTGPVKTPFLHPQPGCESIPQQELTSDQEKKYSELLATVSAWTEVPTKSTKNAPTAPLTDDERMFLTRECLLRYLRAVKWSSPAAAAKRLLDTLIWRREYGLYEFTADYISPENETGKQLILGYDVNGRPCHIMNPGKQNTSRSDRQIHHLVWMLERAVDMMPPGQEMLALLINFKEMSNGQGATVGQGRETLRILQNHYPERLGRALISDLPWYISIFFRAIQPFLDPVTKEKMKFSEPLVNYVPKEQLLTNFGGEVEFEYDHGVYWPALNGTCEQRRKEMRERWEKAGKKIGESEVYLRGGDVPPVGETSVEKSD
ncbi:CRAL/TRIO domain protein [Rhizodiscina lignyota]|uniref:CRAL/TRIO domain protein n=1 Tax=Rhizodiscina lignyota TaxID=1504668 RepID=A0A9P4MEQ1_9PEZI|nr:CRAL/TRIO domain protein [Rhizodiscina lignyota]